MDNKFFVETSKAADKGANLINCGRAPTMEKIFMLSQLCFLVRRITFLSSAAKRFANSPMGSNSK